MASDKVYLYLNVAKNASYHSVQTAKDFQSVIAECVQDEITEKLHKSPFVSIVAKRVLTLLTLLIVNC